LPLLLDTTVLIDALRECPAAQRIQESLDAGQIPWICAVNVDEVLRGTNAEQEAVVLRFLNGLHLAPIGRVEGERAGRWRRDYASKGITLSQSDCLIAAAAVAIDARLVTGNPRHFPMPELRVEHWPVGT
jgi:predicted nucleic acid-binding protein